MATPLDGSKRGHPLHTAWRHMKERCDNPKLKDAKNYFYRGIKYPKKWRTFDGFYDDMGSSYIEGLTLDRIDNDRSYSARNCRWATRLQQNNNTRKNRHITIEGITRTLSEWIRLSPDKPSAVKQRFYVYKWSIEKALNL